MKLKINSLASSIIPPEALTSFESFDEWLAEDATSMDKIKKQLIKVLNNDN